MAYKRSIVVNRDWRRCEQARPVKTVKVSSPVAKLGGIRPSDCKSLYLDIDSELRELSFAIDWVRGR